MSGAAQGVSFESDTHSGSAGSAFHSSPFNMNPSFPPFCFFFPPWESGCILSWVNCVFLGWIRHISLEGERDLMWTSSCLLHATEKKSHTVYILYNCSLIFPLRLLIKEKENGGEMLQCVFLGQEKLNPSFVYKYRVFQGLRESVVFTGTLLKFIIIFLWSLALSTSAGSALLGVNGTARWRSPSHPQVTALWQVMLCLLGGMERAVSSCTLREPQANGV